MRLKAVYFIILLFLVQCLSGGNSGPKPVTQKPKIQSDKAIIFHRAEEPNEKAFSFLIPEGWKISGGITRINANFYSGPANSNGAKLYMKLVSPDEKTSIGWLPDNRFINKQQFASRNQMGTIHPTSSIYNDLEIKAIMSPEEYLIKVAFPFAHPHAQNTQLIDTLPLKIMTENHLQFTSKLTSPNTSEFSAAIITLQYIENGIPFMEKMICVIEDYGSIEEGLWGNKETWFVRAETSEFNKMAPVLSKIGESVRLNHEWIEKEMRNQKNYSQIFMNDLSGFETFIKEIDENKYLMMNEIVKKMFFPTFQKEGDSRYPTIQ